MTKSEAMIAPLITVINLSGEKIVKFQIGDRVKTNEKLDDRVGEIVQIDEENKRARVKWYDERLKSGGRRTWKGFRYLIKFKN